MAGRRFLLLHITSSTGHRRASLAIEQTIKTLDPAASILSVDATEYTSPFVRWIVSRSYFSLIRHQPDIWEYLYDNPDVHKQVQQFQSLLHRYHAVKLQRVLATFRPDAIACTQAYPCGMVADFKKRHGAQVPLIGVLTDYAPHLYWFHETVDAYVVPSEQVKQRFLIRGVEASRVKVLGIPIALRFLESVDKAAIAREFQLELEQPILLIMGGGGGFGHLRDIIANLDTLPQPCQFVVIAGTNRSLLSWLQRQRFRHRVVPLGYTEAIPQLMDIATLLISKPGGMTTSEAMAKQLPLVIVNPIPGQEAYNARYLLSQGAALQAGSAETVRQTVRDLLENPDRLEVLRRRLGELAHPMAAVDVTRLLFTLADQSLRAGQPSLYAQDAA
ncbi:MAG: glycosyltransferase [Candidatus Omnitrophica bacterium]|nr:glycosyltransferase [Candidatus Omnitrophota bacterium]